MEKSEKELRDLERNTNRTEIVINDLGKGGGVKRRRVEEEEEGKRVMKRNPKMTQRHLLQRRREDKTYMHELRNTGTRIHVSLMGVFDWHHPSF